uniref:Uncharacterized protein n=1 Tax=mine drainage metagenome TaxID=410659 RepID=E6QWM8_9ZZZZ
MRWQTSFPTSAQIRVAESAMSVDAGIEDPTVRKLESFSILAG